MAEPDQPDPDRAEPDQPDPDQPDPDQPGPRRITDAEALPLLLGVMGAAGRHDRGECLRLLDEAEATLTPRRPGAPHKARADIVATREAATRGDWRAVHARAWQATTGLTWAFPPDLAVCPPTPGDQPYGAHGEAPCPDCGVAQPEAARFCPDCGAAVERP